MPVVTAYRPASWFSRVGAQKKLSQLESKGLPSFKNWRFVTLTIDPKKFATSESAYEYIKPRLRFFIRKLKRFLGKPSLSFVWKLEFQDNGWPHWHLLLDYKEKIPHDRLLDLWGFGFVEIQRVKSRSMRYLFKYISKGLDSGDLPEWFLKYTRPRVFQTSGIFPPSAKEPDSEVPELATACQGVAPPPNFETLGQRLNRWNQTMLVKEEGRYVKSLRLVSNWWECLTGFLKQKPERIQFYDAWTFYVPWPTLLKSTQET